MFIDEINPLIERAKNLIEFLLQSGTGWGGVFVETTIDPDRGGVTFEVWLDSGHFSREKKLPMAILSIFAIYGIKAEYGQIKIVGGRSISEGTTRQAKSCKIWVEIFPGNGLHDIPLEIAPPKYKKTNIFS